MTADEIKSAITGWCNQDTALQLVEDRSGGDGGFAIGLRSGAAGAGTIPVDVSLDAGSDRLTFRSSSTSTAGSEQVRGVLDGRPAWVHGETSGSTVVVTAHAYTDGLNKTLFTRTVDEVAKTRSLIDHLGGSLTASTSSTAAASTTYPTPATQASPEVSASPSPWAASSLPAETMQPAASTLPAPSFASPAAAATTYTPPSGQPAPQAQPVAAAFAPTHTVPPQGMQAWAAPDPTGAVVATLGGGLPIQVSEVRGAWARVLCSNGWTGWVDGRIIGVAR